MKNGISQGPRERLDGWGSVMPWIEKSLLILFLEVDLIFAFLFHILGRLLDGLVEPRIIHLGNGSRCGVCGEVGVQHGSRLSGHVDVEIDAAWSITIRTG